mgnify:CR=1 FL=1
MHAGNNHWAPKTRQNTSSEDGGDTTGSTKELKTGGEGITGP